MHDIRSNLYKVNFCIVVCAGRSTAEWLDVSEGWHLHDRRSDTFHLTVTVIVTLSPTLTVNPNPIGEFQNIDVSTLDVRNIDVLKVDVVEVDLAEQLTFCKSTIYNVQIPW